MRQRHEALNVGRLSMVGINRSEFAELYRPLCSLRNPLIVRVHIVGILCGPESKIQDLGRVS